jgi:hypothetical protein
MGVFPFMMDNLVRNAGVDFGDFGGPPQRGYTDMPVSLNANQVKSIPWPFQWLDCTGGDAALCNEAKWSVQCWVERDDVTPKTPQAGKPGGQGKWKTTVSTHSN